MAERAQEQLERHFPDHKREPLWHRKTHDGYSSIPRTLPIAMQAIDSLSKGNPGGHTLFCLWARSPDQPLLVIDSPTTFAAEAGFNGERASDTWRRRMKRIRDLGFIKTKKGTSGEFHYVLLLNPNVAVQQLIDAKKLQETLAERFEDRLSEIGAKRDFSDFIESLGNLAGDHDEEGEATVSKQKHAKRKKRKSSEHDPG